jgi:hypothetical protein
VDEVKSLLYAIMERLDVQGANIEQLRADVAKMGENLSRIEARVERMEQRLGGMSGEVTEIKEETAQLKQTQQRFDEQLHKEEDWQAQIMQALSLCSQEREKELKKITAKNVG